MQKLPSYWQHALPLTAAAACWGLATVMTKGALTHVPALTLLVVQLTVSVVFLWTMVRIRRLRLPHGKEVWQLGLIGLLNPGIAYTFGLFGLKLTSASLSTLLWAAEPILILGMAWLILRERISASLLVLAAVAIAGVCLVSGVGSAVSTGSSMVGNLLVLAGVLCCSLYTVLTRRTETSIDPLAIVALQQTFAWIWALVIWPLELIGDGSAPLATVSLAAWAWAGLAGIFYYALAFWFYIVGLRRTSASVAGLFLNLIPIFGVGAAYLFLDEHLLAMQWFGAVLISLAVVGIMRLAKLPALTPSPSEPWPATHVKN
ncbi:MAG: DMT family transporter [Gammaproteobacteria bacterium]|nr:DMT family transporter [Gammaproteobacteria bacterium]